MVEINWAQLVETGGIGAICIGVLIVGYNVIRIVIEQWKNSTEAVNKNTEAFTGLSTVLQQSHQREIEFQELVKEKLEASEAREKETLKKVIEIHDIIK